MFTVRYAAQASEFLQNLPVKIGRRIFNKIETSTEFPLHYFIRLSGRTEYKLRVGPYRVIADIDFKMQLIEVRKIGHRKNVYE